VAGLVKSAPAAYVTGMQRHKPRRKQPELTLVGEVDEWEAEVLQQLLKLPQGSSCTFYIDSSGGSVYGALAVMALIRLRHLQACAVVLSECSSAALLVFGACQKRLVNPLGTFLFHRMRWQSEKRVASEEARHWAAHFEHLERELDELLARLFAPAQELVRTWIREGRYVTGRELVQAGLAELLPL